MKKTLFVASLLACALPAMAESGMTLSGEGIANDCTWNLYATFDKLAYTDTFTTLATVNLNNNAWPAIYAVGYTYSSVDNTLTLGMASYANTDKWYTISLGKDITLGADMPVSFALTHNGSNEGGNNTLILHGATGNTTTNFTVSGNVATSTNADKYSNKHISSVSLGTAATSDNIYDKKSFVLTPATGTNVNLVGARLEHEAYSDTAFKEFVLEEQAFASDEVVRYTTTAGNQKNVYSYDTANGEVTFNPAKFTDNKLSLEKPIELTARTTFIVDDGKTVTIGADKTEGTSAPPPGSAFGNGELVKSGGGTLEIRLNDVNRDIGEGENNDFEGSVTVEEGTLYLFHKNDDSHTAFLGGGENAVITVKEGATLEMAAKTRISIPLGAKTSKEEGAHNIVIGGGAVHVNADEEYNIPTTYSTETSTIKNAVITREGVHQIDDEVRAQLIVADITVYDSRPKEQVVFEHADILADEVHFNGHTIIRNTNLFADEQLIAASLGTDSKYSLEVVEGSHVVYGAGADEKSSGAWGHVDNVYVDQTSKLQTAVNEELDKHYGAHLFIQGTCKLDIADRELGNDTNSGSNSGSGSTPDTDIGSDLTPDIVLPSDNAKGLAVRSDGTVQAVYQGETLTLKDIRYVTDQLSGDMLYTYSDVRGTLDLNLKDPVSALLPDGATLTNTVFTLTLTNFDSSLLVVDKETGELDKKVATLTIDAFKDTQWHLVYGRYDKETNASIFTFSTMENLHINTPEPATATLSLLALAALAARRKRK